MMLLCVRVVMGFFVSVAVCSAVLAGGNTSESASARDKIIGQTVKALARAYVASVNIVQFRDKSIHRIELMKESWFRKKYAEVYEVARELPVSLRSANGITQDMSKAQAIHVIRSLDKKKLYQMIDHVPDPAVAREFDRYVSARGEQSGGGDLLSQVSQAWNGLIQKMDRIMAAAK